MILRKLRYVIGIVLLLSVITSVILPSTVINFFHSRTAGYSIIERGWSKFDNSVRSVLREFSNIHPNLILERSQKDVQSDNLQMDEARRSYGIMYDVFKEWRKGNIFIEDRRIDVKYKIHGSVIRESEPSYSIKRKIDGNWSKTEKIIRYREFGVSEQFYNLLGKKLKLITTSLGSFIVFNDSETSGIYYHYTDSISPAKYDSGFLFKPHTFQDVYREWHGSDLDDVSFNLDLDSISEDYLSKWNRYISGHADTLYDAEYIGRYIALTEFQGAVHDILGNNAKTLLYQDEFYPIWRSEGIKNDITAAELRTLDIIGTKYLTENRPNSNRFLDKSLERYRRMIANDDVLKERDKALYYIYSNRDEIRFMFDSIVEFNTPLLRQKSERYILDLIDISDTRSILNNNINAIGKYFELGYTLVKLDSSKFEVYSSKNSPLRVVFSDTSVLYYPKYLQMGRDMDVRTGLNQLRIGNKDGRSFQYIVDELSKDTLVQGHNLQILYVKN